MKWIGLHKIASDATFEGDISLGDGDKIILGDGSDLQLYHDGTNSYLTNATGDATVQYDDSAENLIGQSLNVFMHKDGEYSRILKQFAPTEFENAVEKFKDLDLSGHVTLRKGERSKFATMAAKIL